MRLAEAIPDGKFYRLYADNYFNSPKLQVALAQKDVYMLGTIRLNRAPGLSFEKLSKPSRGSIQEQQCEVNGIRLAAVLWHDNKQVSLLSSFVGGQPVYQQQRYDKGERNRKIVDCPAIVMEYNKHMGYVDEFNRYIALYRSGQHCVTRHYLRIFFHFIDAFFVNSWVLYRRDAEDSQLPINDTLSLFDFCSRLCSCLTSMTVDPVTPRGRPRKKVPEMETPVRVASPLLLRAMQSSNGGHWPESVDRQRCKLPGCNAKSTVWCKKCQRHLCVNSHRNCFQSFHDQKF